MPPSTHALTAYNALSLTGRDMTAAQIHAYVADHGYDSASLADIEVGLAFLAARSFVAIAADGVARAVKRKPQSGAAWPLKRAGEHEEELVYR